MGKRLAGIVVALGLVGGAGVASGTAAVSTDPSVQDGVKVCLRKSVVVSADDRGRCARGTRKVTIARRGPQGPAGAPADPATRANPVSVPEPGTTMAMGRFAAAMTARASQPVVIVGLGSSTMAGAGAADAAHRWLNLFADRLHAAYPAKVDPPTVAITDSLAGGPGIEVVNAAMSGTASSTYLPADRLAAVVTAAPAVVLHMIGSNDYRAGVPVETYEQNVEATIQAIDDALPVDPVHLLIQSFRRADVSDQGRARWADYGAALHAIAARRAANVAVIDLQQYFASAGVPGDDPYGLLGSDNIHPTNAGHAVIADLVTRFVLSP